MPVTTTLFLLIVALIAANQVILRVAALRSSPWVFWGLQIVNLAVACWILLFGLPGFDHIRFVSWIFGLLILFRIVQNNGLRSRYLRTAQLDAREEEKREQIREMAAQMAAQRAKEAQARLDEPLNGEHVGTPTVNLDDAALTDPGEMTPTDPGEMAPTDPEEMTPTDIGEAAQGVAADAGSNETA